MAKTDTKPVSGIKVSALAKEFRVTSKVLIAKCDGLHIKVKNHASLLTRGQADRLRAKLGGGELLRAEVEKKTAVTRKKKVTKKKVAKKAAPDPLSEEIPSTLPETFSPEAPAPDAAVMETTVTQEPTLVEAAPESVVPEAPIQEEIIAEPVTEAEEDFEPEIPAKRLQSGPDIVAPHERPDASSDTRFGVVTSAAEIKKSEPPPKSKSAKSKVESKKIEEFKPQVSYPAPKTGPGAQGQDSGFRRGPVRRGPVRSGRRGPRHGRALMSDRERYRKAPRRNRSKGPPKPTVVRTGPAEVVAPVTVKNLCEALGIKSAVLISKLLGEGRLAAINDILPNDEAELYAAEFDPLGFGITLKKPRDAEEEMINALEKQDEVGELKHRAPVITVMGHVDHGKTTLLDKIREAAVVDGEAGGITQHIAAYAVQTSHGPVCFMDTPGHSAFSEMRARGANVTDIVVLVVAADDGVMPQTIEAIKHATAAEKRIVIAINKIDLPEANSEKIKGELATHEIFVEGYGGDVQFHEVSAITGQGISELLEKIALEAEVLELKVNPDKPAIGTIVEAHKEEGRGIVATLLVQEGTLNQGDIIVCGHTHGTVRQLLDDHERNIKKAGPSTPVLVTGLNDVPMSGERFHVLESVKLAAEISQKRALAIRQEGLSIRQHVTLENLHDMIQHGEVASLKLILKVDVMGSLNPICQGIMDLSNSVDDVRVDILHAAVGPINASDIHLADASNAIVFGFHVSANPNARKLSEDRGVEVKTYSVIYEVIDDIRKALEGMLKPNEEEVIEGHVEVRQTFKISRLGVIAGSYVTDGTITRNSSVRLIRDGDITWSGKLQSLKRVKDDAKEVREGFECGIGLDGHNNIKIGDIIEAFSIKVTSRTMDDAARETTKAREKAALEAKEKAKEEAEQEENKEEE